MSRAESTSEGLCPDSDRWLRFAAGISSADERSALLKHAVVCQPCADRMRDLLDGATSADQALSDRQHEEIAALLERMDCNRRSLAAAMARRGSPSSSWKWGKWVPAFAAGLCLVVGATWFVSRHLQSQPPLNLLAEAYTSRRTLELQVSGAGYAPLQVLRSGAALDDLPQALLESQLEIKRHLKTHPEDPAWLHAEGRAQLLLWQYDAALTSFQAAADLGANTPEFLIDYASAYYERAERTSTALDYGRALEKLGQALQKEPTDSAALFNRGIVYTKLHQYSSAIDDFKRARRAQTDPRWIKEVDLWLKKAQRSSAFLFNAQPLVPPGTLAERDLEEAMTSTLLKVFRDGSPSLLKEVAAALLREHQDPWLQHMLLLDPTWETRSTVETLCAMARLRVSANPDYSGVDEAMRQLVLASLPLPLKVWRDYEGLYRDTRSSAVNSCSGRIGSLSAAAVPYPWFESQILLEGSLCRVADQEFVAATGLVDRAEKVIANHSLLLASIRIPNFRGQRLAETGYFREAFQTASDALSRLGAGIYPARRAYDFYGIEMLVSNQLGLPYTGYGATRMMADIGQKNDLKLFQMVGLCRHAGFALALSLNNEAAMDLASAERTLTQLRNNPTARIYWRTSRIAWLESQNDAPSLYAMLNEAKRQSTSDKEDLYFNRKLISALCRLEARAGNRDRIEQMATAFWKDAVKINNRQRPGVLRAFRPEVESVSKSLVLIRLLQRDASGALDAWRRFLRFDELLLGSRSTALHVDNLRTGTAIITVAVLGDKVALWLRAGQTTFRWSPEKASDLERRVRRLRRMCSLGAAQKDVTAEATKVFRSIFPEGTGTASRVYVRASGTLNMLPLATFGLIPQGRGITFSFLPFEGAPANELRTGNDVRMTVVAATSFSSSRRLPMLPEAEVEQEITAVRQAFSTAVVIRGPQVTLKALEGAAAASAALHFTGHAVPWRETVGLLVAPDSEDDSPEGRAGIWFMGRPRGMNARLVVLSACSTGTVSDSATVESGQLATTMLLAGGHQVVASLWDVDSKATTVWNSFFYRYISQGLQVAEAMRLASSDLRAGTQWNSPKYWAGFALYEH